MSLLTTPSRPTCAELLAAIAEAADLVELTVRALPLQVAGPADAATALDLWAPAAAVLEALAVYDGATPDEQAMLAALRQRLPQLEPALAALRAACRA
jgi:hypothetical protein